MKKILSKALPLCCSIFSLAAVVAIKPACVWLWHQPEVPKALRK